LGALPESALIAHGFAINAPRSGCRALAACCVAALDLDLGIARTPLPIGIAFRARTPGT
jgi:hypothetical protein